jgi:hypothetical protein
MTRKSLFAWKPSKVARSKRSVMTARIPKPSHGTEA